MTPEELMMPRIKIIAPWPGMEEDDYEVGQIHEGSEDALNKEMLDKYPHLFRRLEWWEERKPEDMSKYVKYETRMEVLKVIEWKMDEGDERLYFTFEGDGMANIGHYPDAFLPATESEYQQYRNTL